MNSKPVVVAILNYNGGKWLRLCMPSVFLLDYPNFRVCVVDNGSSDRSLHYVASRFPEAQILRLNRNLGYAAAYNVAIKEIDAEYILLLNNDVVIPDRDLLKKLVAKIEANPKLAAVTCKIVSMQSQNRIDSVGGMGIRYWRGFVDIGRDQTDQGQFDNADFNPFSFCGAAALIRRDRFLEAGGFDDRFFMYCEDVDLSWRWRLKGYEIGYEPAAVVSHFFSGTAHQKEVDPIKLYLCHRNLLRMILKNCGTSLRWALRNYALFSFLMISGFLILDIRKAAVVARALLWNLKLVRETYAERVRIQAARDSEEIGIIANMFTQSLRTEPYDRGILRRILNTVFDHAGPHGILPTEPAHRKFS